jgi:hypothetical protein
LTIHTTESPIVSAGRNTSDAIRIYAGSVGNLMTLAVLGF